ncbi:MAG: ABC transporter ATP-binding protein, partial [Pseudomonadota bacterium]
MMDAAAILDVKGLRAGYGKVPVLHGVDLEVGEGEIVGLLGHNGMGKTTLLKTVIGIVPATAGSVNFDGLDITRDTSHERAKLGVGYVPQGRGIFPNLSVLDNLRMGVAAHGLGDEAGAVERILQEFPQLTRLLDRRGGALSGGEQQLLALARCLVSEPQLVLLDEPTEGIQPSIVDLIEDKLNELARKRGLSIVLVEQNLEFITGLSDKVMLLQKGTIAGIVASKESGANTDLIDEFTGFKNEGDQKPESASAARPAAPLSPPQTDKQKTAPRDSTPDGPTRRSAAPEISRPEASLYERLSRMTVKRPSFSQLKAIVEDFGMTLSDERIQEFLDLMEGSMQRYDELDAMPDYLP